MPIAPSFEDLVVDGKAEAQVRKPDLSFYDGDYSTAMIYGGAAMADRTIEYGTQLFKATFLDTAFGSDLDTLAADRYNLTRIPASKATVVLSFSRTSGGDAGTIPTGTEVKTVQTTAGTQVSFITDSDIIVGAGNNGPFTVNATAVEFGPDGNVAAATLTQVGTLFDTFTVTNAAAAAGGNDAETDELLRYRCRLFYQTLRRGTIDALEFGAKQVASVRFVAVVEDEDTYQVSVIVADEDGGSNLEMISDVEVELIDWQCVGVPVTVYGSTPLTVDMALSLEYVAGFDLDAVSATIIEAVENRLDAAKPGETVTLDQIVAAVISLYPAELRKVNFTSITGNSVSLFVDGEAVDIEPTTYQKVKAGTITVSG